MIKTINQSYICRECHELVNVNERGAETGHTRWCKYDTFWSVVEDL